MVGLFVSDVMVGKKEVQVGDQILEIAGQSAVQMSFFEAAELMSQEKEKLQLKVAQNTASECYDVCICVHTYVCAYVHTYVHTYIRMYIRMCAFAFVNKIKNIF